MPPRFQLLPQEPFRCAGRLHEAVYTMGIDQRSCWELLQRPRRTRRTTGSNTDLGLKSQQHRSRIFLLVIIIYKPPGVQ